jgi:small GTP-binding protein
MVSLEEKLKSLLQQSAVQAVIYNKNEDSERVEKLNLFARKLLQKEFVIGFAGHFSAGKSSMINALAGENILATSPIPTSANIVKVHNADEDYAILYLHDQPPVKFEAGYDIAQVKQLSKDGELVSLIEIGHKGSSLPKGVTVMDTPGVDSTDDAHAMSTESALHIADMVFYTMDYNHVQSELNFQFTKELMKYNENIYLIVNQVDKHKEDELSFEDFKQSVHKSFAAWGVYPKDIFFTSLKAKDLTHNDFTKVKQIVMDSMNDWEEQLILTAENTLKKLQDEHVAYLEQEKVDRLETSADILSEDDWANRADIKEQYEKLELQTSLFSFEQFKETFEEKRAELLKNAAITPSDLRDKLRDYLESKQEGFKVGGLFSAKRKTEEARVEREKAMIDHLNTVVSSQITGHLKTLMKNSFKDVGALNEEIAAQIDAYDYKIEASLVEDQIQKGALLTGDALLNFANRVADAVKRYFVRQTDSWVLNSQQLLEQVATQSSAPVTQKLNAMQGKYNAIKHIEQIDAFMTFNKLQMTQVTNELRAVAKTQQSNWERDFEQALNEIRPFDEAMLKKAEVVRVEEQQDQKLPIATVDKDAAIERALKTANVVRNVQGFEEVAKFIENKVERLQKQDFTIALFGAFSAGKSSFSNALMGSKVLPVSPNPTTAAINKIRPVSENNPHETADVTLKTAEQLLEDIQASYEAIGLTVSSLEEAYNRATEGLAVKLTDERLNVHKSFIRAYSEGFKLFETQLGTVLRVNREDFEKFVAQENRSCFVDNIDFYYDSPLTRLGVTLVDTPGADSINARHTGVAFEYIRNADAILFITYYNHAFAKADREFLIQLGRVKDAFELDKMFFIVNAIDLASTMNEEEEVKNYVSNELQRFGIRFPRLYGVSSLMALREKVELEDFQSGMAPFENAFHHFLKEELTALAVQALVEEVDKTEERLRSLIEQTEQNLLRKDERLAELAQLETTVNNRFAVGNTAMLVSDAKQELDELLYYVLQRVYYRYPDFFREGYNPSVFAKLSSQAALASGLKDVVHALKFDFAQELRVTNFRLAQFVQKQLKVSFKEEAIALKEMNQSFAFMNYEHDEPAILDFVGPFDNHEKYASVKSHFRNVKAFFEKNEKEQLKEALEKLTKPDAEAYLQQEKERLLAWSVTFIDEEANIMRSQLKNQALSQITTERELLQEESRLAEWKEIYRQLQ